MKNIVTLNRQSCEKYLEEAPDAVISKTLVISITDGMPNPVVEANKDRLLGVLQLSFLDILPSKNNGRFPKELIFNDEYARKIVDFLDEYEEEGTPLIIHCEAGVSRSAAVSAFAKLYYESDISESYWDKVLENHIHDGNVEFFNILLSFVGLPISFEAPIWQDFIIEDEGSIFSGVDAVMPDSYKNKHQAPGQPFVKYPEVKMMTLNDRKKLEKIRK